VGGVEVVLELEDEEHFLGLGVVAVKIGLPRLIQHRRHLQTTRITLHQHKHQHPYQKLYTIPSRHRYEHHLQHRLKRHHIDYLRDYQEQYQNDYWYEASSIQLTLFH